VGETDADALWSAATRRLAVEGFDKVIHVTARSGAAMVKQLSVKRSSAFTGASGQTDMIPSRPIA
jgi:hypothetical protein